MKTPMKAKAKSKGTSSKVASTAKRAGSRSKKSSILTKSSSGKKATAGTRGHLQETARKEKGSSLKGVIGMSLDKVIEQIKNVFDSNPKDVVSAILMDHEGLRNFMSILKDTDREIGERRRAYEQFSTLLKSHTIAEEEIVYAKADELTGRELHIKIAEGYVEHHVADDLMKRIEATNDPLEWSAHANVLSEVVEHHLKEEERDLLPLIREKAPVNLDMEMLVEYLDTRARTQTKVTEKNAGVLNQLN